MHRDAGHHSGMASLVALKCTFRLRTSGRPPIADEVRALIVELARNDSNWGYTSIQDRLENLGHRVSRSTVASVLKEHSIDPAPTRGQRMSWATFMKAHWPNLAAIDFTTVEVWTKGGLVTHYVLFVMELGTRKVTCAGITPHPDAAWILQVGRNLTDAFSGSFAESVFSSWTATVHSMRRSVVSWRAPAFSPSARRLVRRTATRTSKDSTVHVRET